MNRWFRRNIALPAWEWYRGNRYQTELKEIERFYTLPNDQRRDFQFDKIAALLRHAYDNVPFYRKEWDILGLKPNHIRNFNDFTKIPILTKEKIRENTEQLFARGIKKELLIKSATGGTTDAPITLFFENKRQATKHAEMEYFRKWFHWYKGDKIVYIWGAPQDIPNPKSLKSYILNNMIYKNRFLYSSLLNEEIMNRMIEQINSFKPDVIQGYSTPVFLLAKYISERADYIYSPKSIVLSAEVCLPFQRKIIEKVFNTKVFMFYGCREGGYLGVECDQNKGYHLNQSSLYIEITDENGNNLNNNKTGIILFTDLLNYSMPIIRYRPGDMGSLIEEKCRCGRDLPRISTITGRETDVLKKADGSLVPGVSLTGRIVKDNTGIKQIQFVQNIIDKIDINIVKGESFSTKDIENLYRELRQYFDDNMKYEIHYMDQLPIERSGKTRFVISNLQ